jgi:hypothetical protein
MSTLQVGTGTFSERERELLGLLADLLIPRDGRMPAATEIDVHNLGVETVCGLRPDLIEPVRALLARVDAAPPADVAALMAGHPEEFPALSELVASAYFLDPRIAELLGYRARKALPLGDLDAQDAELAELTAAVTDKGTAVFRATPGAGDAR